MTADEHGHFAFTALPAGDYAFVASKAGYVDGLYGQRRLHGPTGTLPLRDGERRLDVTLTVTKLSAVTGTVTDETGAPVSGVQVLAVYPAVHGGHAQLAAGHGDVTDDRGEYRITQLEPGMYALAINDARTLLLADPDGAGTRTVMIAPLLYPATARDLDPRDLLQIPARKS